jgi:hypothetical protein
MIYSKILYSTCFRRIHRSSSAVYVSLYMQLFVRIMLAVTSCSAPSVGTHGKHTKRCIFLDCLYNLTICLIVSVGMLEAMLHLLRSRQCNLPCYVALPSAAPKLGCYAGLGVQTRPGAHPISCTEGTGSFMEVQRRGRGVGHQNLASRLKKEYIYTSAPPLGHRVLLKGKYLLPFYEGR